MSRIRLWCFLTFLLSLAIAAAFLWQYLHQPTTLPIRHVKIIGERKITEAQALQTEIMPHVTKGFFNVPIHTIQEKLLQNPAIKTAKIRRQWPDTILIHITEYQPIAYWNQHYFLTRLGHTFPAPSTLSLRLPHLIGSENTEIDLLKMYERLQPILSPYNMQIDQLSQTPTGDWVLTTNTPLTLDIPQKNAPQRVIDFLAIYPHLSDIKANKGQAVRTVNLHYHNGFAITSKNI